MTLSSITFSFQVSGRDTSFTGLGVRVCTRKANGDGADIKIGRPRFPTFNGTTNPLQTCLPTANATTSCFQGAVPVLAVNATSPSDVQAAVVFAGEHNLRLSVRSTGHDYQGRSTAVGSLLVWVRHMDVPVVHAENFVPAGCEGEGVTAVSAGPGTSNVELVQANGAAGVAVGTGAGMTVSVSGGLITSGGHSPLSRQLGLATQNVLELEVVTADGKLLIANRCQNQDLFWALRGGGGGTFGVVTRSTLRTYPSLPVAGLMLQLVPHTLPALDAFFNDWIEAQTSLAESGWAGYFYFGTNYLSVVYLNPGAESADAANATLAPVWDAISKHAMNSSGFPGVFSGVRWFPTYQDWFSTVIEPPSASQGGHLSSRLFDASLLANNASAVASAMMAVRPADGSAVIGHLVGAGAIGSKFDADETSTNPAWRTSPLHVVVTNSWQDLASANAGADAFERAANASARLAEVAGQASYHNEAFSAEENWQELFWGSNYPRLKQIKDVVDSEGLFVCHHCVGSEEWSADGNCRI
ncbi:hypothetical protein BDK51DRAFT_37577 [Blyttiomyces helicus]|uniref:FAD-binding PCMH-type domain-containing protein n=1 Tax=Blyttiomyces helicus TaxID=388810 RepID=A0A4P9W6I9_9FUNG|nr:hypothetical protein BDK51DRAFT_37577 [Blyttiomyces helicus]|eukprot:RKO86985.1 hypothetical protein BDK51DRAFT_37577 [Blyttiomyces helicus]